MGMGLSLSYILYLQRNGHLTPAKNAILDIGAQNVYFATVEQIEEIIRRQEHQLATPATIRKLAKRSSPFFSEIATLAGIKYHAIDVCMAPSTDVVDLNGEGLPAVHVGQYDVVLNIGTTEHVFNQLNSFRALHDATKIGGVIYCQVPATGYFEHGYFCYTPLFFRDLAKANNYEIVDSFFTMAGRSNLKELGIEIRSEEDPDNPREIGDDETLFSYFNFNILMRRQSDTPFCISLDIATSHAAVAPSVLLRYADVGLLERIKQMEQSTSWRITSPLRFASRAVKRRCKRGRLR
jgi:hypothetical protein